MLAKINVRVLEFNNYAFPLAWKQEDVRSFAPPFFT